MKLFWYKPIHYKKELITAAIESGVDAVCVPKDMITEVRSLAKVKVISSEGEADLVIGKDVIEIFIDKQEKENEAVKHGDKIPIIIKNSDWTIIPLENLISKTTNLIQTVYTGDQAKTALGALEKGATGVMLESDDIAEIKKVGETVRKLGSNERLSLEEVFIVSVEPIGMASRVCVDMASNLEASEGLLCGDATCAFFLVYNENVENPYCDPRPFRVNAGAVHAYVRVPEGKTKYLGELKTGDKVLIVDHTGNTRTSIVGRAKIEERPMMLVAALAEGGTPITLIMQNAETIRLTLKNGSCASIPTLKPGDKVLAYIDKNSKGRHFGIKVEETIKEQ